MGGKEGAVTERAGRERDKRTQGEGRLPRTKAPSKAQSFSSPSGLSPLVIFVSSPSSPAVCPPRYPSHPPPSLPPPPPP